MTAQNDSIISISENIATIKVNSQAKNSCIFVCPWCSNSNVDDNKMATSPVGFSAHKCGRNAGGKKIQLIIINVSLLPKNALLSFRDIIFLYYVRSFSLCRPVYQASGVGGITTHRSSTSPHHSLFFIHLLAKEKQSIINSSLDNLMQYSASKRNYRVEEIYDSASLAEHIFLMIWGPDLLNIQLIDAPSNSEEIADDTQKTNHHSCTCCAFLNWVVKLPEAVDVNSFAYYLQLHRFHNQLSLVIGVANMASIFLDNSENGLCDSDINLKLETLHTIPMILCTEKGADCTSIMTAISVIACTAMLDQDPRIYLQGFKLFINIHDEMQNIYKSSLKNVDLTCLLFCLVICIPSAIIGQQMHALSSEIDSMNIGLCISQLSLQGHIGLGILSYVIVSMAYTAVKLLKESNSICCSLVALISTFLSIIDHMIQIPSRDNVSFIEGTYLSIIEISSLCSSVEALMYLPSISGPVHKIMIKINVFRDLQDNLKSNSGSRRSSRTREHLETALREANILKNSHFDASLILHEELVLNSPSGAIVETEQWQVPNVHSNVFVSASHDETAAAEEIKDSETLDVGVTCNIVEMDSLQIETSHNTVDDTVVNVAKSVEVEPLSVLTVAEDTSRLQMEPKSNDIADKLDNLPKVLRNQNDVTLVNSEVIPIIEAADLKITDTKVADVLYPLSEAKLPTPCASENNEVSTPSKSSKISPGMKNSTEKTILDDKINKKNLKFQRQHELRQRLIEEQNKEEQKKVDRLKKLAEEKDRLEREEMQRKLKEESDRIAELESKLQEEKMAEEINKKRLKRLEDQHEKDRLAKFELEEKIKQLEIEREREHNEEKRRKEVAERERIELEKKAKETSEEEQESPAYRQARLALELQQKEEILKRNHLAEMKLKQEEEAKQKKNKDKGCNVS